MPKRNAAKSSSQRKLNFDDSVANTNVVEQDEDVVPRSHKRAGASISLHSAKRRDPQNTESYKSPLKKPFREAASLSVVTPDNLETATKFKSLQTKKSSDYIPSYIHKNVEYVRKGQIMKLSSIQSKLLLWIDDHYEIPNDFEQNRKFGPLSGSSYVDRVITAYRLGSLKRKEVSNHDDRTTHMNHSVICTVCADLGHVADACPTLL